MNRRTLLTTLGASLVPIPGCLGQPTSGIDATDSSTPASRGGSREVRVTSVGTSPDDSPLKHAIEVIRSEVRADGTARIRTSLTNTADTAVWNTTRIPTFSDFTTQTGPNGQRLLLLQTDVKYETVRPDCWRAALSNAELNTAYTNVVSAIKYAAGESRSHTFDIYGHPENTGPCISRGDYPIESRYEVTDDSDSNAVDWSYRWGFSITVEDS